MTDWDQLHEVEDQVFPPAFASLVDTARRRDRRLRAGLLAAAVALVIGVGLGVGSRGDEGTIQPAQDPSVSEPTDGSGLPGGVQALPGPEEGSANVLDAGRYRVPLDLTLAYEIDLPQGTLTDGDPLYIQATKTIIKSEIAGAKYGVPADPCGTYSDITPVGPTVDDLVTAIRNEPTYRVAKPRPVTIDGARGQHLRIRIPANYDATNCTNQQLGLPGNPTTNNNMEPGYVGDWWILDVEGRRVILQTLCQRCEPADYERLSDAIEDITFTGTP